MRRTRRRPRIAPRRGGHQFTLQGGCALRAERARTVRETGLFVQNRTTPLSIEAARNASDRRRPADVRAFWRNHANPPARARLHMARRLTAARAAAKLPGFGPPGKEISMLD